MPSTVKLHTLAGRPELTRQYELLTRLRDLLNDEPRCLGAAVGGSLASGTFDQMSDVDLVVYCEAGAAQSVLTKLSAAAADRAVVYRLTGEHDAQSVYEKVILQDWTSYELHVIEPTTRMRLRSPYIDVVDRSEYLASRVSDDKPIGRETARPYVNGDDGLIWELFNCMKWLRRGDAEFTVQYLQALGEKLKVRGVRGEA